MDGNLAALTLHEKAIAEAERHQIHFNETILATDIVNKYEEARNEFSRIADNFGIYETFEDWLDSNT